MTAYWPSLEGQLDELNEIATRTLDQGEPEPAGLPPVGSWIRAYRLDMDMQAKPASPWHLVTGWDRPIGVLSVRCRRRPGSAVTAAVARYIGESSWWRDPPYLSVSLDEPSEGVCRQCLLRIAQDAKWEAAAAAERKQAALLELLPELRRIVDDAALDDDACGREVRALLSGRVA